MSLSCSLHEAHYCALQSQTNVYGLAKVSMPCGQQKLLVASLRGKVISMEFQKTRPVSKEVPFTYIPGDAEILSIDAFNRQHGLVVGITFVKTSNNELCQYLNIYSEVEPGSDFNLDSIAQGCNNLRLDFMPFHLYHTEIMQCGVTETVFLLGGSDGKIHLYREEKGLHLFNEEPTEDLFPEFTEMPSPVTCIQCRSYDNFQRRVSAVGSQGGLFRAFHVDTGTKEVLGSWEIEFDGPIMSLCLFTLNTTVTCPSFVNQVLDNEDDNSEGRDLPDIHLAVASAIQPTVVYRSVAECGLVDPLLLSESAQYDAVLCVKVADVDFDGENEVLIGTYGQELLVYKFHPNQKSPPRNTHPNQDQPPTNPNQPESKPHSFESRLPGTPSTGSPHRPKTGTQSSESRLPGTPLTGSPRPPGTPSTGSPRRAQTGTPEHGVDTKTRATGLTDGEFRLLWQRGFPDPVMGLDVADITCDGLQEIVVTSLKGLHILQHDLNASAELCMQRLNEATQRQPGEDVFQQLLSENLS